MTWALLGIAVSYTLTGLSVVTASAYLLSLTLRL